MPETKGVDERSRLPIKLVMPKQGTERKVKGGGSHPKPFRAVDSVYRGRLWREVYAIRRSLAPQFQRTGAAPVRVKLVKKAVAKSHRPEHLFSSATCPIIGAGFLSELFIKATPGGLQRLSGLIRSADSDQIIKELSCVEAIEPITPLYRRCGLGPSDILRKSPRSELGFLTRVRLFDYGGDDQNQAKLLSEFTDMCGLRELRLAPKGYGSNSFTYAVECRSEMDVEALSNVTGVRNIASMPLIRAVHPRFCNPLPLPALEYRSDYSGDVPTVVVVDSGIRADIPLLESWVVGRESLVAPQYRNTDHGTFVAGLLCWGARLNSAIHSVDTNPCAVFDLQVMPNLDPRKGDVETLTEQEFLVALEGALQQHANEYKVWNISLGTDALCSLDEFSPLAEEFDNLQERYQVSFVVSAGNYENHPLLDYPRTEAQLEPGRITTPADSVLGITVGSISHVDCKTKGPTANHPSPFSRHGAGPNYVIKPDLVHYGGTCSVEYLYTFSCAGTDTVVLEAPHPSARAGQWQRFANVSLGPLAWLVSELLQTITISRW